MDKQFGECDVKFYQGAKVNGRVCTMIQVTHPIARRNFLFNVARIYLDNQFAIADSVCKPTNGPRKQAIRPCWLEEYTYMNLQINQGFTDADFDVHIRTITST